MVELENRNANGSSNGLPGTQPKAGPDAERSIGRDLGREGKHQAEKAKDQIRSLAETGKDRVAEKLDHVARALRTTGESLRDEDDAELSQYADVASDSVERVARYLKEHETVDLAEGIERIARQQPLLFLGGAFVAGLAIGRFFKSQPTDAPIEEGYARGGYDVEYGYRIADDPVVTAPVMAVPDAPRGPSFTPPSGTSFTPPSGTFRGPGGNDEPTG